MANVITRWVRAVLDRASLKQTQDELAKGLGDAGQKGGANFLRELRAQFEKRMADLRVQLAKGLINPKEFSAQARALGAQFNTALLKSMDQARAAGKLTNAEYVKLSRQLKATGDVGVTQWGRIKSAILGAGAALAATFGVRQVFRFFTESIRLAGEADAVWNRLAGTLENLGIAFASVEPEVRKLAKTMEETTTLDGEEVAEVLNELVSISGDYKRSLDNVIVVADLAARKQIDLTTAAKLVGKAMVGETGTLKRYGIIVKEGADAVDAIRKAMAGAAANEVKTFAGQTKILAVAWENFREALGKALADSTSGTSVLQRLTGFVRGLTENVNSLLAAIANLGKAIAVGLVVTIGIRLVGAINKARAATTLWLAVMNGARALMGPTGWFIAGVALLTAAFQRMGASARAAAKEAKEALEEFRESIQAVTDEQLDQESQALAKRAADLAAKQKELREKLASAPTATTTGPFGQQTVDFGSTIAAARELQTVERGLNDVRDRGSAILAERNRRTVAAKTITRDLTKEEEAAAKAALKQLETFVDRREELEVEIGELHRLAAVQGQGADAIEALTAKLKLEADARKLVRDLTASQATAIVHLIVKREQERRAVQALKEAQDQQTFLMEMARQIEVLGLMAEATLEGEAAVRRLSRQLFIQEALLRSGAEAGSEYAKRVAELAGAQFDAEQALIAAQSGAGEKSAEEMADPWVRAFAIIKQEIGDTQTAVDALAEAWASGSLGAIAAWAQGKVKENLAAVIENVAMAIGALARGNPSAAAGHFASAAKHKLAAVAWGQLAKSTGGGGGGGGGGGRGSGNATPLGDVERSIEVNPRTKREAPPIHFTVIGQNDPAAQRQIVSMVNKAARRGLET